MVVAFFLSCIDALNLLSSSLSVGKAQQSSVAKCLPQRSSYSDDIIAAFNCTDASESFPIAKTKIRIEENTGDQAREQHSDDTTTIASIDDRENDDWGNQKNGYFSLEKVTQDLLDYNVTGVGTWTQDDCDKVVNIINMWSKRSGGPGRLQPALQQELLLRRVIEEKHAANEFALDLNMRDIYHEIIFSWSKSHENGSANRAEEILDAMQSAYSSGDDRELQPTIDAWNAVIGSYVKSKSKGATEHAMRVFVKLHYLISKGQTDVRPNEDSYAHILKAVASSGERNAPKRVFDLLNRMQNLSEDGFSIDVTSNCHNVYLSALVESMKDTRISAKDAARKAESHLHRMKENPNPNARPDRRSECFIDKSADLYLGLCSIAHLLIIFILAYNIVLTGWSKSGDKNLVENAEKLLKEMEENAEDSSSRISPNAYTYNCVIFCYTWSNMEHKDDKALAMLEKMKEMAETNSFCRPDCTTYNAVMNCITKSNNPSAPYKVEALMEELIEIYKSTGQASMRPTNRSFNACVNAWARSKSKKAPQRILSWIRRFQDEFESGRTDAMPNKWTYNSYLQALAKERTPSSADEAERVLAMMEEKSQDFRSHGCKPDVLTYTNVLHCIALSESDDSFQRAYAILSKMENGTGDVRPNVYTYNVLINVVAKSKLPGKAKIAVRLINRMKEVSIRPITITYNNALNACAFSDRELDDKGEVMQVATMILKVAQETSGANYITYATYFRVVRFFVSDRLEQWRLIRETFRQCCEDGQLETHIMRQIRPALSPHQYGLLMDEATDKSTGRWREEYTVNAGRMKKKPLKRYHSFDMK